MIGNPQRRSWWWGVVMATGIEIALLLSPYGQFFGIPVSILFVVVTLTAHLIFGAVMGWYTRLAAAKLPQIAPAMATPA
jgi:hypothetical protein